LVLMLSAFPRRNPPPPQGVKYQAWTVQRNTIVQQTLGYFSVTQLMSSIQKGRTIQNICVGGMVLVPL